MALEHISSLFGATATSLVLNRGRSRALTASTGPDEVQRDYTAYFHTLDYVAADLEHAPIGLIYPGAAIVSRSEHSEFGQDFLRRFDLRAGLFIRLYDGPSPVSLLLAAPQANLGCESGDAIRQGDRLAVHLRRALRTQQQVADLESTRTVAGQIIDSVRHGVVVVRSEAVGDRCRGIAW